jgi:hypothetical protein
MLNWLQVRLVSFWGRQGDQPEQVSELPQKIAVISLILRELADDHDD